MLQSLMWTSLHHTRVMVTVVACCFGRSGLYYVVEDEAGKRFNRSKDHLFTTNSFYLRPLDMSRYPRVSLQGDPL